MNLKLALRRLVKTPLVSTVAILSLALGIGANAAIFSLFDQMLLRALPVRAAPRAREPVVAGTEAGFELVRSGRRLRARVQLSHVPRSRTRADGLHGPRRHT